MDEAQQIRARRESLGLNGFQILFAAVGLLQTMMKQGSEGVGVGEGNMKIISMFVSISLFAFAAAVVLPLRYTDILCRISDFFLVLACSSLLSSFVPPVLFWFPYLACVFPFLHLLQLTLATLQASLQQLCRSCWTAIRDFSCGAYQRLIRTTTGSKTTPKDDSELSTITTSSPPPCVGLEEGKMLVGAGFLQKKQRTICFWFHSVLHWIHYNICEKSRVGPALVKFERDQRRDILHGGPIYLDISVELERLEIPKDGKRME